ncbi:MAG: 4-hydroxythreonine-4-phosphate dehydrogenase [Bacteroidia bacterium]|nr:MAG: 4-hydroxythreonine-4-phosphate dehydrogenase [Bacteroidia bacterium]
MNTGTSPKIKVGITMGDVNGIGPELILKTFEDPHITHLFTPVIFGSGKALHFFKQQLQYPKFNYKGIQDASQAQEGKVYFIECSHKLEKVKIGTPTEESGEAAYLALKKATQQLLEEKIDVLVTLPINKKNIQNPEFHFPGHTEYFANLFQQEQYLMFMVHEDLPLRVAVATGHIPISKVAQSLTIDKIYEKIHIMDLSLKIDFSIERPKIAVLGLNPHAGDEGLIGNEDQEIILPAIQKALDNQIIAMGPYSADGFFAKGMWKKFDGILAMYHDQGLIPFKALSQGDGVNFTTGLPIIRTSPDHGPAFDIAGKNIADPTSFKNAIYLAIDVFKRRTENIQLLENKLKTVAPKETLIDDEKISIE